MKIKLFFAVGLALLVLLVGLTGCTAAGVTAADVLPVDVNLNSQQTGIWVNGEGKVTVVPDIANLTLGVSSQTATVSEAQSQAAAAMEKIMTALKEAGVAEQDIQTTNFSIHQITRWDDEGSQEVVVGYRVNNMVIAKIRDMENVGSIIDTVAAAGGDLTRINGISFTVDNPEQYYAEARDQAMKDASGKAEQLASLSGVTLGKSTYVSENVSAPPIPYNGIYFARDAAAGSAPETAISPGESDIIINVQVAYAIK
ncbi:MAG: SIMPL domain-containing protein [Dehalococcoidales bacterium]|nr:SIMPL domain-containing protein [Dehalococcoidales bacterium]